MLTNKNNCDIMQISCNILWNKLQFISPSKQCFTTLIIVGQGLAPAVLNV